MTSQKPSAFARIAFWSAPADGAPKKKPPALAYGAEEQPPAVVTWISAVQHLGVVSIFMVYPLILARQAGWPSDQITNMLQLGMIVLAVAVLLQALPRGPVGSRFLAPVDLHRRLSRALAAGGESRRPAAGLGHDDLRRLRRDRAVARVVAAAAVHSAGVRRPRGVPGRRDHRARGAAHPAGGQPGRHR